MSDRRGFWRRVDPAWVGVALHALTLLVTVLAAVGIFREVRRPRQYQLEVRPAEGRALVTEARPE